MKKYFLKIVSLVILIIAIYNIKSYAAISAASKTVKAGENVSILVSSDVAILSYKVTMTDAGGLTLKTSTGGTGAGTATITDAKATGMKSLATYTFKTPNVTKDTTYKVKFSATAMEDENFNAVSDDTATATIIVKAPVNNTTDNINQSNETSSNNQQPTTNNSNSSENEKKPTGTTTVEKSTNANLSNLGIKPNDFSGFRPGTTSYNVTVPNDVKEVTVYATAKDSKAKISGTGYKELSVGKNTVKVVVTAEAGNTKTYKINITREGEETVVPNTGEVDKKEDEITEKKEIRLSNIVLDDKLNLNLSPNFDPETFEYSVELGEEYKDLEKLELTAISNIEGAKIEITGNEEFTEDENLVTIVVTNPENNEKVSYTISVIKNNNEEVIATTEDIEDDTSVQQINDFNEEQQKRSNIKMWIIRGIILVVTIVILVLLISKYRSTKKEMALPGMFFDENEDEFFDYDISKLNYENPDILKKENNFNDDFINEDIINEDSINEELISEDITNQDDDIEQYSKEEVKEQYLDGFENNKSYEVEENDLIEDFQSSKRKSKGKHF